MFFIINRTERILLVLTLLLLTGCSRQKTNLTLSPLQPHMPYDEMVKKTEGGDVIVRCAPCSKKELDDLLGQPSNRLFGKQQGIHITPVKLYIENQSNYAWSLSPYDVQLPLAEIKEVKDRLLSGATMRGLASFTATGGCGILLTGLGAAASIFHPLIGASLIGLGCSIIVIAPLRSHSKAVTLSARNIQLDHTIETISLNDTVIIHPHEEVSKLIFIKNYSPIQKDFMLRLYNHLAPDQTIAYKLRLHP